MTQTVTAATSAPSTGGGSQHFSGTGTENIGTLNVSVDSKLSWYCPTCSNANFQILNDPTDSNLIATNALDQTSGQTVIPAGTYHNVTINTEGQDWTINITPGTS